MNLIAAELERARGKGAGPRVLGKLVHPRAPLQVFGDIRPEGFHSGVPNDPLSRCAEAGLADRRKPKVRERDGDLIPDGCHIAMEDIRVLMQGAAPNFANELLQCGIVDFSRIDLRNDRQKAPVRSPRAA